jgi:hypothetical protein
MIHSLGMEFLIDSLFAAAFSFQSAIVERNCGERMEAILGKTEAVNLIGADPQHGPPPHNSIRWLYFRSSLGLIRCASHAPQVFPFWAVCKQRRPLQLQ